MQRTYGGECAHADIEARVVGDDADAADERPHELFAIFQACGLRQPRQIAERRKSASKYGIGVDRIEWRGFKCFAPRLESSFLGSQVAQLGVHKSLRVGRHAFQQHVRLLVDLSEARDIDEAEASMLTADLAATGLLPPSQGAA